MPLQYFDRQRERLTFGRVVDSRCRNTLLHDQSRSPTSSSNRSPPRSSPRARYSEIHCRHCCRCLPVQPYPCEQQQREQPHGFLGCSGWLPSGWPAGWSAEHQGPRQRRSVGNSKTWLRWWWSRREPKPDGPDNGGSGDGRWGIRREREEERVLSLRNGHAGSLDRWCFQVRFGMAFGIQSASNSFSQVYGVTDQKWLGAK